MDLIESIEDHICKILSDIVGMKILFLDNITKTIVSMTCSKRKLLQTETFLFNLISQRHVNQTTDKLTDISAVYFLCPSAANIAILTTELSDPNYNRYWLYFNGIIEDDQIEKLAMHDKFEVVSRVEECYYNYYAITSNVFITTDCKTDSILSLIYNIRQSVESKTNIAIRYCGKSEHALASKLDLMINIDRTLITSDDISVLIIDRSFDPIAPLLIPLTYQAMIFEYLVGINDNKNQLGHFGLPLNRLIDQFYCDHANTNYHELCDIINKKVLQSKSRIKPNVSVNDLREITCQISEHCKTKNILSYHVNLLTEVTTIMASNNTADIYYLQRSILSKSLTDVDVASLKTILNNNKINKIYRLSLLMLYTLTYGTDDNLIDIVDGSKSIVESYLKYCGKQSNNKPGIITSMLAPLQNLLSTYNPEITAIAEKLATNTLDQKKYPYINHSSKSRSTIIIINGGVTYAEATHIAEFNQSNLNHRVILGGDMMHNCSSFIDYILKKNE